MSTSSTSQFRVSRSALSIALLICSAFWFASVGEYYATSAFKSDWSATPLFWMLLVMLMPVFCFYLSVVLIDTRKHARFSRLVWGALLAAVLPVSLGTVLAVWAGRLFFSVSGVSL